MNLNQLRYFVSVAQRKSFSRAAEENYITQTAMTQQIRLLEENLETELIDRRVRPIRLTPAGEVFYKEIKPILERIDFAITRTREASQGTIGTLNIGYTRGYEGSSLSETLRHFHQNYPGIFVNCIRASSDLLASGLLGGEYDLIFADDTSSLKNDPRINSRLIETVPLMGVLYQSHPLAVKKTLHRKDFKGEPIIFATPNENYSVSDDSRFLQLYKNAGYSPDIQHVSSDMESVLMMVAAEHGITILPEYYTRRLQNADNLLFLPMEGKDEYTEIYCFSLKENLNQALHVFLGTQTYYYENEAT
ncbi:MAG: LysR family transcriptional regulator [Lachnospiraceae bacterium]|nr:LysR family transcriptional regulator [Lachnospiraceae bacterium]